MIRTKYSIEDLKEMFLKGKLEQGIFTSFDEDGCNVVVNIGKDGFSISTNQKNGWIRINSFTYDKEDGSWIMEETYEK